MGVVQELRAFLVRGSVIDLAVGVVIGAAFNGVVTALVTDIITPLISIPGAISVQDWQVQVGGGTFQLGHFLNAVLSFLLTATAVFFFVVKPSNVLLTKSRLEGHVRTHRECPFCLSSIPRRARRCAFCTAEVPLAAEPRAEHATAHNQQRADQ
jgi:large conductance mechanosensitive channel